MSDALPMPVEFAKAVCRQQAMGSFPPVHPDMGRRIEAAIGDDPEFDEELRRLRKRLVGKRLRLRDWDASGWTR